MFVVLWASIVNASNHTKCVSLSDEKYKIYPTLTNLHPNEYSQELHYYPFAAKFDKCIGSCDTLNDLSNRVCVPNKTEHLNTHAFNMITEKNKSNILTKIYLANINADLMKKKLIQINGGITINVCVNLKNVRKKIFFHFLLRKRFYLESR